MYVSSIIHVQSYSKTSCTCVYVSLAATMMTPNNQQFLQHYNLQQPAYGAGASNAMYSPWPQPQMQDIERIAHTIYQAVNIARTHITIIVKLRTYKVHSLRVMLCI